MNVPEIDCDGLHSLLEGGCVLIDVREPDEYEEGHIGGARPIPLATVPDSLDAIPRDTTVYVVCAAGGRSARAVEFLLAQGFDAVNVAGGTQGWEATGRPVVRGTAIS